MLSGVSVHHQDGGVHVVDQDDRRLASGQRGRHPFAVHRSLQLASQFGVGGIGQVLTRSDQHAGSQLVVFGLANQVGGHMHRVGGVIGEDSDLGWPRFGVDAHPRTAQSLGGRDIDVARPGDHVDRCQCCAVGVGAAVSQQRHRLSAADRPDLIDAQQPGRGQNGRMRHSIPLRLRRAGYHQRVDARGLGGHHVHHHAGWVHRIAPRHVQAYPLDRNPPLGDRRARAQCGCDVGATLPGVHGAGPLDHHLQRFADVAVQSGQRRVQRCVWHPDGMGPHTVERCAEVQRGLGPALGDGRHNGPYRRQHGFHIGAAAWQSGPQLGSCQLGSPQVDTGKHGRRRGHVDHSPRAAQVDI
ncbi:Uncharacterised protein [Mycobacterium tuberculosis]|uniref:Uncharacterized protein n=1 Tax=Mycobacterium tuberculosis TaxID=1773 RepID=A0A655AA27_MYCTX|nr:Uncharacterised protein [Mycobacterium tuberculosis]CKT53555.1 Uncharacterised protein [Mycobacterium tuberculosis]COV01607.1 Uncharacterised protein [Mycobacterium tuberculosis]